MRASLLAVLSFVAGLGAACKKGDAAADDGNRERPAGAAVGDAPAPEEPSLALPVVGQRVRRGDLVLTVTTTGQVRSEAVARLKVEAAGTVEAVLVRPGDRVRRGQALVRLDPRPFDLEVQEAQAAVEEAQVRYVDYLVDSLVTGEPPSEERRRNALVRSGLNAAKVRLEKARLARERATITAPFEGVVDRVDVAVGERLGSGQDV
ncbi:MAG TPA: biotin/lipoyl-binding protein, partial [Gemmatimonadales bacterium]|nr:biotin/lipoyl-binding protein [Gemmatimonadales bacterium]